MEALLTLLVLFIAFSIVMSWIGNSPLGTALVFVYENLHWIAPLLIASWVWWKYRHAIARWYYFTFHPHPAEPLVRAAIGSGAPLDGKALATALGELPSDNSILREVRLVQAERLVGEMQIVSRARARELEKRAKTEYERAAAIGAQEALALAAVALERAKAALQASRAIGGR